MNPEDWISNALAFGKHGIHMKGHRGKYNLDADCWLIGSTWSRNDLSMVRIILDPMLRISYMTHVTYADAFDIPV